MPCQGAGSAGLVRMDEGAAVGQSGHGGGQHGNGEFGSWWGFLSGADSREARGFAK